MVSTLKNTAPGGRSLSYEWESSKIHFALKYTQKIQYTLPWWKECLPSRVYFSGPTFLFLAELSLNRGYTLLKYTLLPSPLCSPQWPSPISLRAVLRCHAKTRPPTVSCVHQGGSQKPLFGCAAGGQCFM